MRLSLVVAVARNGVIGLKGRLPWRLPSELALFRSITMGKPVLMGRRTWDSLPRRPLPGRENVVITRQPEFSAEGAHVAGSVEEGAALAERLAAETGAGEVCCIGGAEIFNALLDRADRIYLTRVDLEPEGDTFMPPLDWAQWEEVERRDFPRSDKDPAAFSLRVLDRRDAPR